MIHQRRDVIPHWRRVALFARRPLLLGSVLCVAQGLGYFTGRDSALLGGGASAAADGAPLVFSILIIIAASILPGIAILRGGTERGLILGIIGLLAYYVIAWSWLHYLNQVLPVLAPSGAWYVSQILGVGWQFNEDQNVSHLLSPERRTVFISYRRKLDEVTARMLKQELTARGFDVFLDVDDLGPSSRFDQSLLAEIERRHNFLIVLSPGSLDRCVDEDDWLRLEITHALSTGRKIVPLTRGGFDLAGLELPDAVAPLPLHNAVEYSSTYHREALRILVAFLSTFSLERERQAFTSRGH
jgi:hypothetical protein